MDCLFDTDQLQLRRRIRTWVDQNLMREPPVESNVDNEARRLVTLLGKERFTAYVVPQAFGGIRDIVQARDLCLLREELARGSALADSMLAMQALGSYPITLSGDAQQKSRYLPPMARGEAIGAFALTEPEAGSDIASMQTLAVKRGSRYFLNGTKRFISNAGLAHTYVVFASTNAERRGKGISGFIVEAETEGLVVKERTPLLSPHPIGVLCFENCSVPESQLIGREGDGLQIALQTLDTLRCTVGAAAVGMARRAMDEALEYGQKRRQFQKALADFQGTQFKLADMATELEASRLMVYQAAWTHDHGGTGLKEKSSMAKLFATEAAQRIVDQALQIHGGAGLVTGTAVERLYRDVRALRIYEGTSEIQKLVIAKALLAARAG